MCTDVIILAGGSGERLWPVSNSQKPKQFMSLADGDSFLQSAMRRAASLGIEGDIYVVTREEWKGLVIDDALSLAKRMGDRSVLRKIVVLCEPFGKNTAPALLWASRLILAKKRENPATVLMMASDHIINPDDLFAIDVAVASWHAERENLVTFAIPPSYPATGYGYIKAGPSVPCPVSDSVSAFAVDSFREKPDATTARRYVDDGHYYWNSGIYAFRADFYVSQIALHANDIFKAFDGVSAECEFDEVEGLRVMARCAGLREAYERTPSISIDYALSEKCARAVSVRASFLWDDVGTWDSLAKYYDGLPENAVACESRNNFVLSDIPVALCGVDDLVVVIKNGKALISRKGETNMVKDALAILRDRGQA